MSTIPIKRTSTPPEEAAAITLRYPWALSRLLPPVAASPTASVVVSNAITTSAATSSAAMPSAASALRKATELQREREENARRAVLEERVRIARELHDVVAHHVSVIGVQAGAARRVMARQPTEAAQALSSIEGSSRTAVLEMQRLLGFLRSDGDSEGFGAQPGLDRVGD